MSDTSLALGCMRLFQLSLSEAEQRTLDGIQHGILFFDHADIYGRGESETRFGQVLQLHPGLRDKIQIQSKCSVHPGYYNLSKNHIIDSVEHSLRRLQTTYLDSLLLHRPDVLMEPDEIAEAVTKLQADGKIRKFGVSNMTSAGIELLNQAMPGMVCINQLQFGLGHPYLITQSLNSTTEKADINSTGSLLEYCQLKGIQIQAWSPLRFGAGMNRKLLYGNECYQHATQCIKHLSEEKGVTPTAIMLAWIARHPSHIMSILGSMNLDHLHQAYQAMKVNLSRAEWYELYFSVEKRKQSENYASYTNSL